jgi:K(+)-stimulated pyrophosphate-energized sodium pump
MCAQMTKEECAAHCDKMGCSAAEKEYCMSMYDAEGKFIGSKCDLEKCKGMTAEECTAYCDKMGCTPEQKAACLKMIEASANKH